jgi:glutamine synthetase
MLEKFYLAKERILKKSLEFFINSNSLIPKIGCELEFFLFEKDSLKPANEELVAEFIAELQKFYIAEKERGISQIEIKTDFTADLEGLCRKLEDCKNQIQKLALEKNLNASFVAQPFIDDCGSALQFNISLHEKDDKNLFLSDENLIKKSAESLLSATNSMMTFLAPQEEDYQRFDFDLNKKLFQKGKFTAPVNLSFGSDNRTCAIRVPALTNEKPGKRLEYRLAAANADPFLVIAAILISLTKKSEKKFEQVFGNAFDEKYRLENFCGNLDEARASFFEERNLIREKFEEFLHS